MALNISTTAFLNLAANSTKRPSLPKMNMKCYVRGGPPIEWQRSYRYYTNVVGLPLTAIITVMCLAANAIILLSILRRVTEVKPRVMIVCSLVVSDLLLGSVQIYRVWGQINVIQRNGGCTGRNPFTTLYHVGYHLCFVSSIGSLVLMSVDCYLCVTRPLTYVATVTRSHVLKALTLLWLLVATYTTIYYHSSRVVKSTLISVLSTCFAVPIVIFQVLTFVSYKTHNNAVAAQFQNSVIQARNAANERKIAISVVYLLGTLVIAYLPRILTPIISAAVGYHFNHMMALYSTTFLLSCATARPIVTYTKNSDVREGVKRLLRGGSREIMPVQSSLSTRPS